MNIFVAFYERTVGRGVGSPILIADAKHTISDVWVTITVIAGAGLIGVWQGQILNLPQLAWLDVILAFPVALLVFACGWDVIKDNLPWLVDASAIALAVPGVINCHDKAFRGLVGRQVLIEMHLIVNARICKHCFFASLKKCYPTRRKI